MLFTVVCITAAGNVARFPCRNLPAAQAKLAEEASNGRWASGSIFDSNDEEIDGFAS